MEKMKLTSSPRLAEALATMGIHDFKAVLMHFPYRYEDLTPTKDPLYHDQQRLVLVGKITSQPQVFRKGHFVSVRFTFKDHHQHLIHVIAFNRPYLAKSIIPGTLVTLVGKYDTSRQLLSLVTFIHGQVEANKTFKPIYRLPHEIPLFRFSQWVQKALTQLETLSLPISLPQELLKQLPIQNK
jgi:ATP-dependent DNA helicase RecG